jgi:hypothetical protein
MAKLKWVEGQNTRIVRDEMRNLYEIWAGNKKEKATLGNLFIGHSQREVEVIERFAVSWVLAYIPRTDWYI